MLGDFLREYWVVLLVICILAAIGVKLFFSTEPNRAKWDHWKLNIPFIGRVAKFGFYVQWLQTLSNLLSNGVPLVQALQLTQKTVQNRYYREKLGEVTEKVKDGIKITTGMKSTDMFPPSMVDLIAVADQTGRLDESVSRAARYYEGKLSTTIKWFMSSFTIVILVGMALLVGVLCYTMLQAIYGSMENMRR